MPGKYEYCRDPAWDSLRNPAWAILEKYDNWPLVLQGVVARHAALGELAHASLIVFLGSTIISQRRPPLYAGGTNY